MLAVSCFAVGVDRSLAFSFGVLNWLVQMVVICALGSWSLGSLKLSLRTLWRDPQAGTD